MDKIGYGRHTESGEPIVLLRDLPEILLKVNELVEEYGELIARIERVTTAYHDLRERLDNHINNYNEHAGEGRPVPK